jgi:hypothetical protein
MNYTCDSYKSATPYTLALHHYEMYCLTVYPVWSVLTVVPCSSYDTLESGYTVK